MAEIGALEEMQALCESQKQNWESCDENDEEYDINTILKDDEIEDNKKESDNYMEFLTNKIEKEFQSNFGELLIKYEIAKIFAEKPKCKYGVKQLERECLRLLKTKHFTEIELATYSENLIKQNADPGIVHLIEDVFQSKLRKYISYRELAPSKNVFLKWNETIRNEWDGLLSLVHEKDLLNYVRPIVNKYRRPSKN